MKAIAEVAARNENFLVHHESIFGGVYHRTVNLTFAVIGKSVVGVFINVPFLGTAYLLIFVNLVEMT